MPILIFLLFIVGLFIYSSIKSSFSAKTGRMIPEKLELNSVRDALMEKQGWPLERAEAARVEYVRFLTLLQEKPGFMLIPWPNAKGQDDLDQCWHQHILDTAKYGADCSALFGRMIHHNPHVLRGSVDETDAAEKTQGLYARTFGTRGDGSTADLVFLSSYGVCGTAPLSSSHGAHDHGADGGHGGDSGHGCGGHSCGGHGCGGH